MSALPIQPDGAAVADEALRYWSQRSEPSFVGELRRAGLARFSSLGWPGPRNESWRFTDIGALPSRLAPNQIELTDVAQLPPPLAADAARLVFVNGYFHQGLSTLPSESGVRVAPLAALTDDERARLIDQLPGLEEHPFAALNSSFFADAAVLLIDANTHVEQPVELVYWASGEGFSYPRCIVIGGGQSSLTLVEQFIANAAAVCCPVTEIDLAAQARCHYHRVHAGDGRQLGALRVRVAAASQFVGHCINAAGTLNRVDIDLHLNGAAADCEVRGLSLTAGDEVNDFHVRAVHQQPQGRSQQIFRSVLEGQSKAVFDGLINVVAGAQQTDASQDSRSLLLNPKSVAYAVPRLEILADDVKCAHGATAGFLDPDALFYLRSRGIDAATARSLLIHAFAREQVDVITCEPLRERLWALLADRFGALGYDSND